MNRHERRKMDAIHRKFTDNLVSDTKPYTDREKEVLTAFLKDVARHKKETGTNTYPRVNGVFGEWVGADGFVEKVYPAHDGDGSYYKLWGNSFLFKVPPERSRLLYLDLAKYMVFGMPREIMAKYLAIPIGFMAFFRRKRFVEMLDAVMTQIINRNVAVIEIPQEEYHRCARELKRAARVALNAQDYGYFYPLFEKLIHFVVFFLESDTAYMFRVQDAFGEGNGLWDGLRTLLERENHQMAKWKFIQQVLKLFLWRYPEVRALLDNFFRELNYGKIRMDDGDKYFSLTYVSYNFGGRSYNERMALREQIDNERRHVFIKI